jgi:hypothetical protein
MLLLLPVLQLLRKMMMMVASLANELEECSLELHW